jgi:hypothetical protein
VLILKCIAADAEHECLSGTRRVAVRLRRLKIGLPERYAEDEETFFTLLPAYAGAAAKEVATTARFSLSSL